MEADIDTGIIYSLTCKATGKSYIGQAKDYKFKDGIPYRYGLEGRWNDHISVNSTMKIHQAIIEYGPDNFIINKMLRCPIDQLDAREAEIIAFNNTLVPNGYNVMKHSRVKERNDSNVADFYIKTALSVEVKPIKNNGEYSIVYVYIEDEDESKERTRITFGQGNGSTFEKAVEEAKKFIKPFQEKGIPVSIHPEILGIRDVLSAYHSKISSFKNQNVSKIIITKNKSGNFHLIVLFIFVGEEKTKICFGGKTIQTLDAYKTAKLFIERIKNKNIKIEETKSLQEFLKSATGSYQLS